MVRWLPAALLALTLPVLAVPAAADNDDEIEALADKIEAGKFAGLGLAQAYMELGTRKLIGKDTPGALAAYDKAVATAPKYGEAYVWRSFGRIESGALAPAVDDLSLALTFGLEDRAGGFYLRAEVKAKMKDYPGAIADYDQAIALDQDFGHAYIGRGQARRESGDEAGALADLDHAIAGGRKLYHYKNGFRLVPHYAAIFRKLGWVGWNDDTPPDAYLARGRLWLDKADYERARPDLEYAAQHSIDNPDALIYFGLELLATQQCDDGERRLDKAAEMMGTARATLVEVHRDFIAKTPCAGDMLQ